MVGEAAITRRFMKYVFITPACWIWIGSRTKGHYGNFFLSGKIIGAHRAAYELLVGPIDQGMYVCHKCDNKLCVNPQHLWLGTPKDNLYDAKNKQRLCWGGEGHPTAKLSDYEVENLRRDYANGDSLEVLAKKYSISSGHASALLTGKRRKTAPIRTRKGRPKLRWCDVDDIRKKHAEGETRSSLAFRYGVKHNTLSNIVRGLSWKGSRAAT